MSTEPHKQLIIKMITFSNNMAERHKKSLKHHSQAMLRTVLRYAQASKVALLLVLKLCFMMAKDMLCYFKCILQHKFDSRWDYR